VIFGQYLALPTFGSLEAKIKEKRGRSGSLLADVFLHTVSINDFFIQNTIEYELIDF